MPCFYFTARRAARKWLEVAAMKISFATRILPLAALLCLASGAGAQTASSEQRTHGINAPATNIGPSPGQGTPDPFFDAPNAKSAAAGAGQGANSGAASDHSTPHSEISGTAQTEGQNTSGIWPFAIPIALVFVGVPLAGMLWMRRSKSKR